jgi:putative FmdB family regulatory protein
MPIYSYTCKECKSTQDLIRKVKDANKTVFCEACGAQMEHTPEVPSKFVRGSGGWSSPA